MQMSLRAWSVHRQQNNVNWMHAIEGVGNLRKCEMRKVICGMKSAEVGCGTVGNTRNAE